jgi:hypothetical protein
MSAEYEYQENLTIAGLESRINRANNQDKGFLDLGVSINRTNAVPLDSSSIIFIKSDQLGSKADGVFIDETSDDFFPNTVVTKTADQAFAEAALDAALEAGAKSTAYPGQQIMILGQVQDSNETVHGKVLSFILQPKSYSKKSFSIDETDNELIESEDTTVAQELAYKAYVDELTTKLQQKIGNLSSIMNFRGCFDSFTDAEAFANWTKEGEPTETYDPPKYPSVGKGVNFKPGDVILIRSSEDTDTGADGAYPNGKPGMEYVCSGIDVTTKKPSWSELGFGSQVATFIGGTTNGLVLPATTVSGKRLDADPKKVECLIDYICKSDDEIISFLGSFDQENSKPITGELALPKQIYGTETVADTILDYVRELAASIVTSVFGTKVDSNSLTMPENVVGGNTTNSSDVLNYIQESDNTLATFIGTAADGDTSYKDLSLGSLRIPKYLPTTVDAQSTSVWTDKDKISDDTNSLIKYIQEADTTIVKRAKKSFEAEALARRTTDKALANFIGTDITIDEELGNNDGKVSNLSLPEKLANEVDTPEDAKTVFEYIKASDQAIMSTLGAKTSNDVPDNLPTGEYSKSNTVLAYIQESDEALKKYVDDYTDGLEHVYYRESFDDLEDIKNPKHGNYAIITEVTGTSKTYKTAYIYDKALNDGKGGWAALDGNYSAQNVYFDQDIIITEPIGVVTKADIDTSHGRVVRQAAGHSMQEFFADLMAKVKNPKITNPSLSISFNPTSTSFTGEVGETYSLPMATATLTPGSYSYGSIGNIGDTSTGIVAKSITLTDSKNTATASASTTDPNKSEYTPSIREFTFTDDTETITYTATCSYDGSPRQPINNIWTTKAEDGTDLVPIPGAEGANSLLVEKTCTATGYRKVFAGPIANGASLTSEKIRSLSTCEQEIKNKDIEFIANAGDTRLVVAFRKDFASNVTFEYYTMNWEDFQGFFGEYGTVAVHGANNYEAKDYTIYEYIPNAPFESPTKFRFKLN